MSILNVIIDTSMLKDYITLKNKTLKRIIIIEKLIEKNEANTYKSLFKILLVPCYIVPQGQKDNFEFGNC